ncbi:glutamyl-tRNA reductase [Microbacterium protaetiae]|uniref:Glutamyl-tRNA reductase n=1 Tax=Microbacterium protaetiae TaxID=2509458 RepID=A0A4P6END5_9MICO|nr:glutamyl-tRNA reductase [Microbacterium protaetiae]QAY59398.1 glutamyl-tRNA reductase [Microbacterium protaetiae]
MLLCFSSSHRTAALDTVERLERRADEVIARLAEPADGVSGSVVLSTCNRFEVYLDLQDAAAGEGAQDAASDHLVDAVATATGLASHDLRESGILLHGEAVAEHVFSVASGLESIVVGEGEIAGQVRRSLEGARERGTVTRELERVFQLASRTSRGVKNNTELSRAGRSVVRLALDMAETRITDWAQTRVLLVGTGRYAGASLAALRDRGVTDVRVYSRTGRAAGFVANHDIAAVPLDGLEQAIADSDILVACSVAPTVIVDAAMVEAARNLPGALERRLVIDLGLPRNVDPAVATLPDTELLDLETLRAHAPLPELGATDEARALVEGAVAEYRRASAEDAVTPALVALRSHVFDVLDGEIAWARKRGDTTPETEAALRHLAGVLLHGPSVRARELAADGRAGEFADAVTALFGVEPAAGRLVATVRADDEHDEAAS